jgi:hypothetical protein
MSNTNSSVPPAPLIPGSVKFSSIETSKVKVDSQINELDVKELTAEDLVVTGNVVSNSSTTTGPVSFFGVEPQN